MLSGSAINPSDSLERAFSPPVVLGTLRNYIVADEYIEAYRTVPDLADYLQKVSVKCGVDLRLVVETQIGQEKKKECLFLIDQLFFYHMIDEFDDIGKLIQEPDLDKERFAVILAFAEKDFHAFEDDLPSEARIHVKVKFHEVQEWLRVFDPSSPEKNIEIRVLRMMLRGIVVEVLNSNPAMRINKV